MTRTHQLVWQMAVALLGCGAAAAEAAPLADDMPLAELAGGLRPGQFAWDDSTTADAPVTLVVSVALQRLYVFRGNMLVGVSSVSTGRPGHSTPLGSFQILQKARWHRSNLYSNAPMPFMQRLTWGGIAIHAGWNPGYPASHGCVRVPMGFARALFAMTTLGQPVSVTNEPVEAPVYLRVEVLALADFDGGVSAGGGAATLSYTPAVFMTDYRM